MSFRSRSVASLASVLLLLQACDAGSSAGPTEPAPPGIATSVVYSTVTLTQEDFESTPLGGEPYPFIAETWCPNSFVGASTDYARSGTQSFRYFHGCVPGTKATGTSLSFAMCTRWPTRATYTFSRLHPALTISGTALFSASQHEPPSGLVFNADGRIYLLNAHAVGTYTPGTWTTVETTWDFVAGTFDLTIDNAFVGTFPTAVRKAFWIGTFADRPGVEFYDDDVTVTLDLRGERQNCDGTEPLPWAWPPPEGQQGG